MVANIIDSPVQQAADEVRANWGWLMFMGVALTVLGIAGLYMVGTLTIVSILWFGFLVIAGGVLTLIDAFRAEGWKAKLWEMLIALLYIVAGIVMVMNPGASAAWFTMFIAAFLLVTGIFRIIIGFQIRDEVRGWGWTVFGGIASIVLAFMIFSQWPVSGLWVIGLFIAIEMIMQGTSMISIAMAAKASKDARAQTGA
ncbi:HdeD family acid-resistance protein [Gammaproteobacteria bacterium]|nr:HdeD family acid-resistance protein [Gammaproteobacteria bacterium]